MRSEPPTRIFPAFVNIGRPSSPVQLTGGYLGASYSATPFQTGDTPIPDLLPPKGFECSRAGPPDAGSSRNE